MFYARINGDFAFQPCADAMARMLLRLDESHQRCLLGYLAADTISSNAPHVGALGSILESLNALQGVAHPAHVRGEIDNPPVSAANRSFREVKGAEQLVLPLAHASSSR
jgi:hypothetical protein